MDTWNVDTEISATHSGAKVSAVKGISICKEYHGSSVRIRLLRGSFACLGKQDINNACFALRKQAETWNNCLSELFLIVAKCMGYLNFF